MAHRVLDVSSSKCDEIEQSCSTSDQCLKEAIRFWLKLNPFSSWRWIIHLLDDNQLTVAADEIRYYAEPLLGKSLT